MTDPGTEFTGALPHAYETVLVPAIFEPYAVEVARRVATTAPGGVLEIAAGTGVLTRALAADLPDSRIVATDLSQAMLDEAAAAGAPSNVVWRQADAQVLPFDDASFDVVTGNFGLMFVPDKVLANQEALRVLGPSGRYIFAVWDAIARNEFNAAISLALRDLFPADPPGFLERLPHGYHHRATIEKDLTDAGFGKVEIDAVTTTSRAASAHAFATGMLRGTPAGKEVPGGPAALEKTVISVAAALTARFGDGPITGSMSALIVTARP